MMRVFFPENAQTAFVRKQCHPSVLREAIPSAFGVYPEDDAVDEIAEWGLEKFDLESLI